ncbi:MAG: SRPBCC domain-containing protein [Saprospiraceae bacterium]|nr:SRPBCC domain-containing protein [Saprospiraceae bacterium]MBK7809735.1 SRPBCC domain-containing protein [Saprospiraceae bacterium]MBK9632155.1 SRPBCC domain-containing protein [Saprospiraceae bacterium]
MKRIQYSIKIDAPASKVFNTMLGLEKIETYNQWTSVFNASSTYEGEWSKGSKMYFIGFGEDGERRGMISEIAEYIPNRFVSIRHYGMVKGETEITEGPEVEKWAGGLENYTLEEKEGVTTVIVDIDITEEYMDYFNENWPKSLEKLKEISEN